LALQLASWRSSMSWLLNKPLVVPWIGLAASFVIAFGVWNWAENILVPTDTARALANHVPIANNSDLYPRWLGAREALLHHRDPYAPDVTREIQIGFYGRPLDPSKPSDPPFQQSFVYPLYVVFLLTPTLTLPFRETQEIFRWLLLFVTGCSVPLWMYAVGFRAKLLPAVTGIVLVLSTYPAVLEFHMQNLAALALFLLSAAAASAVRNWLVLGGFLLALATFKPDVTGLIVLWFLLWSAARWKERRRLLFSFVGSMTALVIAAEAVSPHWIVRFLAAVYEYPAYGADPTVLQLYLPSSVAKSVTAALVCVLCALCWRWRKAAPGTEHFRLALALVSAVTIAILPKLAGYNQPLLIPALLVLLARRRAIWNKGLIPRCLVTVVFGCQLWQWVTAIVLSVCSLVMPAARLRGAARVPEYTLFGLSAFTVAAVLATAFSRRPTDEPTSVRT
jgi:hypothetical protein